MSLPLMAGITGALADAGMPQDAMQRWWNYPRRELGGLTPYDALRIVGPPAQQLVLDLARADAAEAHSAEIAQRRAA